MRQIPYTIWGVLLLITSISLFYSNFYLWKNIEFIAVDYFIYGMILFLLFIKFLPKFKHRLEWFEVFIHELTHTIFALLTFNKMINFMANRSGNGVIEYQGRRNWVLTLSPYCVPVLTIALCMLYPFFLRNIRNTLDFLIGFSFVFHLRTFWKQLSPHQPDIKVYGVTFSYLFIASFNLYYLFTIPLIVAFGGKFEYWWKPLWQVTINVF